MWAVNATSVGSTTVVLIPVKSFELAKGRLSQRLDDGQREQLARRLAETVVAAARPMPTYVVCDNDTVAEWAGAIGVGVLRVDAVGLNAAMTEALGSAARLGHRRAIISHADLPLAHDLTYLDQPPLDEGIVVVADRHGTGTNVMALPLGLDPPFILRYGPGSAQRHQTEAERLGLRFQLIDDERLGWDLDTPDDLAAWLAEGAGDPERQTEGCP